MNLDAEERKGYLIPSSMKKVWAVQLELLKVLLNVCEKHQLKIWADGGTLLGTVREHGYIPWDDDIDMAMLRKDYDKLLAVAQEEFKSPYYFQSGYTEKNYPRGHAQLRKDNTAAINKYDVFEKFHQGIFIDIFVYDEIPDDKEKLASFLEQIDRESCLLKKYCDFRFSFLHPFVSIKSYLTILPLTKIGFHQAFMNYDKLLKGKAGGSVACVGFSLDINHFCRSKDLYQGTIMMPFEDVMMPVPFGYDVILRTQYGDYMKPAKAPSYHGGFLVLDTDRSYLHYLPGLRKKEIRNRRLLFYNKLKSLISK